MAETYVSYDLETSGSSPKKDRIIEVGAVKFDSERKILGKFSQLVDPQCDISPMAWSVHHIGSKMVKGCPTIAEVLPQFFAFIEGVDLVMAQMPSNRFDVAAVHAELQRLDAPLRVPDVPVISTIPLAKWLLPGKKSYSLENMASHVGLDVDVTHRALADAYLLASIFLKLLAANPEVTTERILRSIPVYSLASGDKMLSTDLAPAQTVVVNQYDEARFGCECGVPWGWAAGVVA